MGRFRGWARRRGINLESFDDSKDTSDKFRFNNDDDVAGDYEKDLAELTKVVSLKYHSQFTRWLGQLADENNDTEIKEMLRKISTDNSSGDNWKPHHPRERDEIVTPKADRGGENISGGEG